jgi:hypothetical protein
MTHARSIMCHTLLPPMDKGVTYLAISPLHNTRPPPSSFLRLTWKFEFGALQFDCLFLPRQINGWLWWLAAASRQIRRREKGKNRKEEQPSFFVSTSHVVQGSSHAQKDWQQQQQIITGGGTLLGTRAHELSSDDLVVGIARCNPARNRNVWHFVPCQVTQDDNSNFFAKKCCSWTKRIFVF